MIPEHKQRALPNNTDWILCDDAEERTQKAAEDDAFVLVNGVPLKLNGVLIGFPLENIGELEAGEWYLLADKADRIHVLQEAFKGNTNITLDHDTQWMHMRPVQDQKVGVLTREEIITTVEKAVQRLPTRRTALPSGRNIQAYRAAYRTTLSRGS